MPLQIGHSTRVILGEDGWPFVTTREYELKEGERMLDGVKQLDVRLRMDEIVVAENVQLYITPKIIDFVLEPGDYKLYAELPDHKWEPKRIASIVFEDGRTWDDPTLLKEPR